MLVGKPGINYISLGQKKEKHPADIMLNKAYVNSFLSFTLHETEVPPKDSDSEFSFVVSFRTFSCNTCQMSGNISSTLING